MLVGIPKEIVPGENRVAVIPPGIQVLTGAGFKVVVQSGAGEASHYDDEAYSAAGATIAPDAKSLYEQADLILKVRHLIDDETTLIKEGTTLVCMLDGWFNQALLSAR